jgi:hypothetical protein
MATRIRYSAGAFVYMPGKRASRQCGIRREGLPVKWTRTPLTRVDCLDATDHGNSSVTKCPLLA